MATRTLHGMEWKSLNNFEFEVTTQGSILSSLMKFKFNSFKLKKVLLNNFEQNHQTTKKQAKFSNMQRHDFNKHASSKGKGVCTCACYISLAAMVR